MCGRFASSTPPELLRDIFGTRNALPNIPARYNVAPTQDILAVRYNREAGERWLDLIRWGLIPHWAKDPAIGAKLINARAESLCEKSAFRDAFRRRRCLVPADAFYEWKAGTRPKRPYAIRRKDGAPLAFAGLWENWRKPDGLWLRTCTIITTDANQLVAPLHDRMPAIIDAPDYPLWLGEEPVDTNGLLALLRPFPSTMLEPFPVGLAVNDVRNDAPSCLLPWVGSARD